jgi:type VI secretion system secreted protein VgrG
LTAGKSLAIGCGTSFLCSVRDTLRLFAYKAGMKLVAAAGDIDLKALTESINVLAKLNITQTANRITISAKEEVVINGGGSYARFAAGALEMGTTGSFVAHAATHSLPGGKSVEMSHTMPPVTKSVSKGIGVFHVGTHGASRGAPGAGLPFTLYKDGVVFEQGHIDERGNIAFKHVLEEGAQYELELVHGQRYVIDAGELDEQHLSSAGMGYHGYRNAGGSITDDCPELEQDRLLSDPGVDLDLHGKGGE